MNRMKPRHILSCAAFMMLSTTSHAQPDKKPVQLLTLDPGHFHAALVQKTMYPEVDNTVHVYTPGGADAQQHLERVSAYNNRPASPTAWKEVVYTGPDYLQKMLAEKRGNVVVLSGNNQKKAEYILRSLQAGLHVYADKPMAIDGKGFAQLQEAFALAAKNNLLLYDIMTERFEITSILMRELSRLPSVFGTLQKGTPQNPAVVKESVHHFYKLVSGAVLTRPAWFFDVAQQGHGIADVMTHLVDLVQWECFPDQSLDYKKDIRIGDARRWTTDLSRQQFATLTKTENFPPYLQNAVANDTLLRVFSNGEVSYTLRGVHAKTRVIWNYEAPAGSGDTYSALMRGTRANLVIRQGAEQQYTPVMYIEPAAAGQHYESVLREGFKSIAAAYPGVELKQTGSGWEVLIPEKYKENHEEHFARVTQNFLRYLQAGTLPAWEVPNMLAKYYTTTKALEVAQKTKE